MTDHDEYRASVRHEYEPLPPPLLAEFQRQAALFAVRNKHAADWWAQTVGAGCYMSFDATSPLWPYIKKLETEAFTIDIEPDLSKGRWKISGYHQRGYYESSRIEHEQLVEAFADYKPPMRLFVATFSGGRHRVITRQIIAAADKHDALHLAMQEPHTTDESIEIESLIAGDEPRIILAMDGRT